MITSDDMETEEVLMRVREFAEERGIKDIVVASTRGEAGVKAAEIFNDHEKFNLVVVAHSTGFKEVNQQEMTEDNLRNIKDAGRHVLLAPMVFHTLSSAIGKREGFSGSKLVADTLRLFSQGTKVAVEIVMMACDAGLVESGKSVIGAAGSHMGVNTALLIHSSNSIRFFDSRIREVIIKPSRPENLEM